MRRNGSRAASTTKELPIYCNGDSSSHSIGWSFRKAEDHKSDSAAILLADSASRHSNVL